MSTLSQRHQVISLVKYAVMAGAGQDHACETLSLSARTLQIWQIDTSRGDQRPTWVQTPINRLSELRTPSLTHSGKNR
jgi:putative transposase